ITSASVRATPSWSNANSVASSTVLPATSTHSTCYRAFLARFERDRGCTLGAAACSVSSPAPERAPLLFVGRFAPGLRPLGRAVPAFLGGVCTLAAAEPSVTLDLARLRAGGDGASFTASFSLALPAGPISRSAAGGVSI